MSNKQKNLKEKNLIFVGILKTTEEKSSIRIPIQIRLKMSRIRNTAKNINTSSSKSEKNWVYGIEAQVEHVQNF